MTIGLIDIDSKIPNLALMKISNYYKNLGEQVEFVQENKKYEKIDLKKKQMLYIYKKHVKN